MGNKQKGNSLYENFGFVNQVCKLESQAMSSELKSSKTKRLSTVSSIQNDNSCIVTDSEKQ